MKRFMILGFVFGLGLLGTASAGTFYHSVGPHASATTVAGTVRSDGAIFHGTGFTVTRMATGRYRITFASGDFSPSGCAAVTAKAYHPSLSFGISYCGPQPYADVNFESIATQTYVDENFEFIAVAE
jgi:hypothetical protein